MTTSNSTPSRDRPVTPLVRATAKRLGVDLNIVNATGAGGRVTMADVKAAAPPRPRQVMPAGSRPTPARPRGTDVVAESSQVLIEARNRNVDIGSVRGTGTGGAVTVNDVRASVGIMPADHSRIPPFTASGVDPQVLRQYPGPVRAAMAAAPTTQDAHVLGQRYAGMSDAEAAEALRGDGSVPLHLGGCKGNWPG